MIRITGRAVRISVTALAAAAAFALPLALTVQHGASAQSQRVTAADDLDLPVVTKQTPPKPKGPGDYTGSWVWDGQDSHG